MFESTTKHSIHTTTRIRDAQITGRTLYYLIHHETLWLSISFTNTYNPELKKGWINQKIRFNTSYIISPFRRLNRAHINEEKLGNDLKICNWYVRWGEWKWYLFTEKGFYRNCAKRRFHCLSSPQPRTNQQPDTCASIHHHLCFLSRYWVVFMNVSTFVPTTLHSYHNTTSSSFPFPSPPTSARRRRWS